LAKNAARLGRACGLIPCRQLPQSEYRTPITALAGFIPAHEAPGMAECVAPLSFEIVTSLSEIEPNHGVARTMPLRLGFVAEWRKRDRLHARAPHRMREATSNGTESLNNRPPCSHWRPICLSPGETASFRCLIQVNEDDPTAPSLGRPRIRSTGHGGQQTGGPLKTGIPSTH
jgi:hypothetical protein